MKIVEKVPLSHTFLTLEKANLFVVKYLKTQKIARKLLKLFYYAITDRNFFNFLFLKAKQEKFLDGDYNVRILNEKKSKPKFFFNILPIIQNWRVKTF